MLDSTVLDDAVARQDTVTMLVTQIRRVRRLVPALAEHWVREHNLEPGRPSCDWEDATDVERLISELVDDANELIWAAEHLDFDIPYRTHRPMVERTLAWLVRGPNRRLRYRGVERNRLSWSHRCAAVNLQRLLNVGLACNNGWATN